MGGIESETGIDVSVIVPFLNAEKHIESCMDALLKQEYPHGRYEIIMVDNNSTDRSIELVRKHPRIRLLSEAKQGAYAARNRGAAAASGRILAFTDADCTPCPTWLPEIVSALGSSDRDIVLGRRQYPTGSHLLSMLEHYEATRADSIFSWKFRETYYGYTNNMGVRKAVFERFGPFLEIARGADTLFVRRVVEHQPPEVVCFVPEACVRHLEMSSPWMWVRKKFIYGRSLQENLRQRGRYRKLTIAESRSIVEKTLRSIPGTRLRSGSFVLLTWVGRLSFMAGKASVAFRSAAASDDRRGKKL